MLDAPTLYERVLAGLGADGELPKPRPPRSSAAVVPWRRTKSGGVEVFWIKRAPGMAFMGGWHAFPGGGLSPEDSEIALRGEPRCISAAPADGAMPTAVLEGVDELAPILVPGLVACAIRELFEETGILPARGWGSGLDQERLAKAREALVEKRESFAGILDSLTVLPDAERLVYAGRWLTPPLGSVRFDNRFFLLDWERGERFQPYVVPGEAESGEWIGPAEAIARWRTGEVAAAPPILHILRVLAEDGPVAGVSRLHRPKECNLGAYRLIEFRPGVLLFPLRSRTLPPAARTNCYLLGTGEAVLVDPGSPDRAENERLCEALRLAESRLGRRVTALWLTHHHPDHVDGVEDLRRGLGVPVLAHEYTSEILARKGIRVDGLLRDGQQVVLDGAPALKVRVVHTPGHAQGHLCFLEERFGSLLAGDMVAGFGTIVIDPPEGDMDAYLESLQKLQRLDAEALFPGHGPMISDVAGALEKYHSHRLEREEMILAAWRAGNRDPAELLSQVYDDVPAVARPLARRQLTAHLERLRRSGRLGRAQDAGRVG